MSRLSPPDDHEVALPPANVEPPLGATEVPEGFEPVHAVDGTNHLVAHVVIRAIQVYTVQRVRGMLSRRSVGGEWAAEIDRALVKIADEFQRGDIR